MGIQTAWVVVVRKNPDANQGSKLSFVSVKQSVQVMLLFMFMYQQQQLRSEGKCQD